MHPANVVLMLARHLRRRTNIETPFVCCHVSICPYVFLCKMFVKSVFFVYSDLEHSSDEKKKGLHFFLSP